MEDTVITIDSDNTVHIYMPKSRNVMELAGLLEDMARHMKQGNYNFDMGDNVASD